MNRKLASKVKTRHHREIDMSLELMKMELKLDPETIAMLRGEKELTGMHMNEIARQILRDWAQSKVHESNVRNKALKRMGFAGWSRVVEEGCE